jgi:hypothetical protein
MKSEVSRRTEESTSLEEDRRSSRRDERDLRLIAAGLIVAGDRRQVGKRDPV